MKTFATLAAFAVMSAVAAPASVFATEATEPVSATVEAAATTVVAKPGKMIYGSDGRRIAAIYSMTRDGNPQVILDNRLITVPVSTLSDVEGKLTSSLTKSQVIHGR